MLIACLSLHFALAVCKKNKSTVQTEQMQKLTRKFFQLIFKNICSALYQTIAAANASTPVLSPVEMQMAKKLSTAKTQFIFSTV